MTHTDLREDGAQAWADALLATCDFGDVRNSRRAIALAAQVARHPAGTVTRVCADDAAACQAAYDWLENPRVRLAPLRAAVAAAAARACAGARFAWVALDATELEVTDRRFTKGGGRLDADGPAHRGWHVLTALALRGDDDRTAGVVAQRWWTRVETPLAVDRHARPWRDKESWHWWPVAEATCARLAAHAPGCTPWLLCDRGADAAELLLALARADRLVTIRACYDRRLVDPAHTHLRAALTAAPRLGVYTVGVAATPTTPARTAYVAVHGREVTLALHERLADRTWAVGVWAVWAHEVAAPAGATPLDWLLLTTYPVADFADAALVVAGYARRARIELFHRTWKSGGCDVEATQLRSPAAVQKWATLLAAVATRELELRDRSRAQPDAPATAAYSAAEIEAVVALRAPRDHVPGQVPTLGRVTRWIAELGGYTGRSSGGPPGVVTIRRGLDQVAAVVRALDNLRTIRRDQS